MRNNNLIGARPWVGAHGVYTTCVVVLARFFTPVRYQTYFFCEACCFSRVHMQTSRLRCAPPGGHFVELCLLPNSTSFFSNVTL